MKEKRLCIVTMNGGIELIGELFWDPSEETATLDRPMSLTRQGKNIVFFDMMKSGMLSGDSIELNMKNRLYISTPAENIVKAYSLHKGGLILQGTMPPAVNQ